MNRAEAILNSRDKLLAHRLLARAKVDMPITAFANSPKDTADLLELAGGAPIVVKMLSSAQGRGVVLAETKKAGGSLVDAFRGLSANFLVQEFVAEAAGADTRCLVIGNKKVLEVNSSPGLEGLEKATGRDIATNMIEFLEQKIRVLSKSRQAGAAPGGARRVR